MKNVEGCASNMTALQRFGQSFFDNQLAARAVDDAHALLHRCNGLLVNNARCLRSETNVQCQIIGFAKKLFCRHEPDCVLACNRSRDKGIMTDQLHTETACAPGYFQPDAAEAENTEFLSAQFRSL